MSKEKPDVTHSQTLAYRVTPSIILGIKRYNIPIIYTLHSHYPICPNQRLYNSYTRQICEKCKGGKFFNSILQRCIKGSYLASMIGATGAYLSAMAQVYTKDVDFFIAPSIYIQKKMLEFGFSEDKVSHIPNFLNIKRFSPEYTNNKYIAYYGVLTKPKGIFTLLKAVKEVKNTNLKIIGNGDMKDKFVTYAKKIGLSEKVQFHGYIGEEDLFSLVQRSAFTVLSSEAYEISPMTIYESYALGKPVIGSKIGGISELIEDGVTGLLFEPGNAEDLAEKINWLISRPSKIVEMGKNARKSVEDKFTERHMAEGIYNSLIDLGILK